MIAKNFISVGQVIEVHPYTEQTYELTFQRNYGKGPYELHFYPGFLRGYYDSKKSDPALGQIVIYSVTKNEVMKLTAKHIICMGLTILSVPSGICQSATKSNDNAFCSQLKNITSVIAGNHCSFKQIFAVLDTSQCKGNFEINGQDSVWNDVYSYIGLYISNKTAERPFSVGINPLVIPLEDTLAKSGKLYAVPKFESVKKCLSIRKLSVSSTPQPLESFYSYYLMIYKGRGQVEINFQTAYSINAKNDNKNKIISMIIRKRE